jgi:hypothetical protein
VKYVKIQKSSNAFHLRPSLPARANFPALNVGGPMRPRESDSRQFDLGHNSLRSARLCLVAGAPAKIEGRRRADEPTHSHGLLRVKSSSIDLPNSRR